ncbi:hypothetical protein Bhyg_12919 [Pseudolycoriella hygida]|uniref:Uncharacterized protein n=1 Tax=Pseudolycoriella hygida TaxID=35572 RepID=A0A9Q0RZT3_9DIPT|nr:hypothetical protein Bhyg_12919 [Pseudolycoriella hygida]
MDKFIDKHRSTTEVYSAVPLSRLVSATRLIVQKLLVEKTLKELEEFIIYDFSCSVTYKNVVNLNIIRRCRLGEDSQNNSFSSEEH